MKVLITGGAGFIGSQLGFYLKQKGHSVVLVDNLKYGYLDNLIQNGKPFSGFVAMDVREAKIENLLEGVDVVFHLAGISSLPENNYFPAEAYSCNVAGTANVLEMTRRKGVKKIVFSSTSAVYEDETEFPLHEDMKVKPTLIYSQTKKACEDLCHSFENMYGMDITILRFFNVYGPHMDYLRPNPPLVSYIVKCLLDNELPILHSDGKQARDMVYVTDVLKICEVVMTNKKAKGQTFNVGSGKAYSVQEVFNITSKFFRQNKKIMPIYRDAKLLWEKYPGLFEGEFALKSEILEKEVNKYSLASTIKSKKILGWQTKVSLEEGLRKTVEFAKKHSKKH